MKKLTVKVNTSRRGNDSVLFNKTKEAESSISSLPATPRGGRIPLNLEPATSDLTTSHGLDSFVQTPENGGLSNGENSLDSIRRDFKERLNESSFLDSNRTTPASELENSVVEFEPHPSGIKLTRPGYETSPPLGEIPGLDENGECWLKSFSITRRNYGRIYWAGRINVAGLDLDQIVEIKRKSVVVYPEELEHLKTEQGSGLNQKAEVSLIHTYPRNKDTQDRGGHSDIGQSDSRARLRTKSPRLGFRSDKPPKNGRTSSDSRTVSDSSALFRTARLSFGQLGSARTFGQLGQPGQSRAELPNDETHPVQPMKMIFSFFSWQKSRFEGVTVSRIALL